MKRIQTLKTKFVLKLTSVWKGTYITWAILRGSAAYTSKFNTDLNCLVFVEFRQAWGCGLANICASHCFTIELRKLHKMSSYHTNILPFGTTCAKTDNCVCKYIFFADWFKETSKTPPSNQSNPLFVHSISWWRCFKLE